jgi:hypothetical protein
MFGWLGRAMPVGALAFSSEQAESKKGCPSDRPIGDLRSATPFNSLLPERQLATNPMVAAATRDELIIRA